MDDYRIELLNPDHFDRLIPLMKDSFGMNVSVDYFKWKFLQNPAGHFVGFVAISGDNEYAAYYGVIPEVYNFGGSQRTIYQSCDTMTHSMHRRKGLFQRLAVSCYDYLRKEDRLFVIGFGGGQSTPGFTKFGWKKVFDIHYLFRPRILSVFATLLKGGSVSNHLEIIESKRSDVTIVLRTEIKDKRITQHVDDKFFQWRLSNPIRAYQIRIVNNKATAKAVGYFIYYIENSKIILFDFFMNSSEARVQMIRSLDFLSKDISAKGIVTIAQRGTQFFTDLRKSGFLVNPYTKGPLHERIPFIFYANEKELETYGKSENWKVVPLCHDSF